MIGFIFATDNEAKATRDISIASSHWMDTAGSPAKRGVEVVFSVSGVGKVNAASCTQRMLDAYDLAAVYMLGTCGASDKARTPPGTLVLSVGALDVDFDVREFAPERQAQSLQMVPRDTIDRLKSVLAIGQLGAIVEGFMLTSDRVVGNTPRLLPKLPEAKNAVFDMETSSFLQVASRTTVPHYGAIRVVSDAGDPEEYWHDISTCSLSLSSVVLALIRHTS